MMLEDVAGLSLNVLKIFVQHCWPDNAARCWLRLNRPSALMISKLQNITHSNRLVLVQLGW